MGVCDVLTCNTAFTASNKRGAELEVKSECARAAGKVLCKAFCRKKGVELESHTNKEKKNKREHVEQPLFSLI